MACTVYGSFKMNLKDHLWPFKKKTKTRRNNEVNKYFAVNNNKAAHRSSLPL